MLRFKIGLTSLRLLLAITTFRVHHPLRSSCRSLGRRRPLHLGCLAQIHNGQKNEYRPSFPDFPDPGTSVVGSFVQSGSIVSLLDVDSPCSEVVLDTLGLVAFSFPTALLQQAITHLGA
jgi:hypothetical protein